MAALAVFLTAFFAWGQESTSTANVPAGMLADSGMKRHYKDPEPRQTLRRLPPVQQDKA